MKHGRHASEYEKVRKSAGLARPQYQKPPPEFPEMNGATRQPPGNEFDDDFRGRMAVLGEQEAEKQAEAERRRTAFTLETGARMRLGEYRAANVDPPFLDADGNPKFSLSFLCRMGWTIEMIGHENKLVSPVGRRGGNE